MPTNEALAAWRTGMAFWRMMAEAQAVIALRTMGMAGLWTLAPGETTRMVTEKQQVLSEMAMALSSAAVAGGTPGQVFDAALVPVGRRTSANARRLSRAYARRPR